MNEYLSVISATVKTTFVFSIAYHRFRNFHSLFRFIRVRGIEDGLEEGTKAAIEDEMLRVFRKLSPNKKECVIQVARTLLLEGPENKE